MINHFKNSTIQPFRRRMLMISQMIQQFNSKFDTDQTPQIFFAPYQLNIMGGHTDYNKGKALPFALPFGMYAVVHKREDNNIRLHSANHPDYPLECELTTLAYHPEHHWANYPKGVIYSMKKSGLSIDTGFDILFVSDTPDSKSFNAQGPIEFVTALLLNDLFNLQLDRLTLVKYCQKTEINYIGITKGMINKMATAFGKKDYALLLDCDTFESEYIPFDLGRYQLMIIDTQKTKIISDTAFTERHNECEIALHFLQSYMDINHLGELTTETLANANQIFQNNTFKRRLQHIVTENERTEHAADVLKKQDMVSLGKIFKSSQISLQNDYAVTDEDIEQLIAITNKQIGVLGTRLAAGDSEQCTIALIDSDYHLSIKKRIFDQYLAATGKEAHFYEAAAYDGAKEVIEGEFDHL